ncbi:nuclear transport factor 2 family protein [Aliifodinibius salicampi]|uniref:Nuclear transport factor 2 family protein n=1 Tax=Fodinibius salicampi TaxID=1920655 RepID=A0ABT3Q2I8_9BACT|nr:nuclear transport factor 2 family protein [Fodinibius salicampi]MCW9714332.1 nuclear transport factor 2 family protein [Fodinibius salicampi]
MCYGQEREEEKAVLETVQKLFDAMAEADSAKAASVFMDGGHTFRINEAGIVNLGENSSFVESIGNFEQTIVERMWNTKVLVDDNVAMAWTPYDLHVDGTFSHCGTNLISLIKTEANWKIADITYNVKQNACEESPLGPLEQKY